MITRKLVTASLALGGLFLSVSGVPVSARKQELPVVQEVDSARYAGTWYEIALLPHWFERGCTDTKAQYTARSDGRIDVLNTCLRKGQPHQARALAWRAGPGQSGKFKVRFFWPFSGHYWVIALDPDYQWAVVGHPSRRYFWILSRTPQLPKDRLEQLLQLASEYGFDRSRIQLTPQQ